MDENEFRPQWASYGYNLGMILRTLRRMRGLTQQSLAELAGLSRNQISNLERNIGNSGRSSDPSLSTLYRIARALRVPPAVLLPRGDELVANICPPVDYVAYDFRWPSEPADVMSYYRQDELVVGYHEHLGSVSPEQAALEERLRHNEPGPGLPIVRD